MFDGCSMICLVFAVFVVGVYKDGQDSKQCFLAPIKSPASPGQARNVMPQVCVCAFYVMSILFVVNIPSVLAAVDDVAINRATVGIVVFRVWRAVRYFLQRFFVDRVVHGKADYLSRIAADHRHKICVYAVFVPFPAF